MTSTTMSMTSPTSTNDEDAPDPADEQRALMASFKTARHD
jgi:hypothetical protein